MGLLTQLAEVETFQRDGSRQGREGRAGQGDSKSKARGVRREWKVDNSGLELEWLLFTV